MVNKTMYMTLSQCGELNSVEHVTKEKDAKNTISETINTIATGSELVTKGEKQAGFFSENAKLIDKASKSIEKAVSQISNELIAVDM
jgi:hypothetical protein